MRKERGSSTVSLRRAKRLIRCLHADTLSPSRELRIADLVFRARVCSEARQTARALYRLIACGSWPGMSGVDGKMLVYGLMGNPALIADVRSDMERILTRPECRGLHLGWQYVQSAPLARAGSGLSSL